MCKGGGSGITPDDKIKASSGVLPPFVVGEDDNNNNVGNIRMFGYRVTDHPPEVRPPVIAGSGFTSDHVLSRDFIFAGRDSTLRPTDDKKYQSISGITLLGQNSKVYTTGLKEGENVSMSFYMTGVLALGAYSDVFGQNSWTGGNRTAGDFQNGGVILAPYQNTISTPTGNWGTIIAGSRNVLDKTENLGVIIIGTVENESGRYFDDNGFTSNESTGKKHKHYDVGSGIYIRGAVTDGNTATAPACVRLGAGESCNFAVELHGCIKFQEDLTVFDANGTQIINKGLLTNTAKTISQLQEKVALLEAKLAN